ncbi:uncharacterized protein LOC126849592 [Cataglyphis hispanica]|uniref:uncharacterized protein LOC126849592 n=1 Tax=Cataglyphis hispanica TaxID=1086592 RepID=UPI00217F7A8A|nr:uncharacterized protein LOC126849592 [Cataglyphis hispanica]
MHNFSEFEEILKQETLKVADYQEVNITNILQTVPKNSMNIWHPEKSSEMDADEELEEDSPTTESQIITDDDLRSATLLKSITLKCDYHSFDFYIIFKQIYLQQKFMCRKPIKHRKFIDMDSEDLDLMSDCNAINYKNVYSKGKNNGISKFADHVTKSSLTKPSKVQSYQTASVSFFNVFFDIVFWPFVFLRAKQ